MRSTKREEAPRLTPIENVDMVILGSGERLTLIKMEIRPGAIFPEHSHPNEQIGTCVAGVGELVSGGKVLRVEPGVSWTIPENERHRFVALGDSPVIIYEAWSPPRSDYLAMASRSH